MGLPWNEISSIQPGPVETNLWAGDHNGTVAMFVALSTVMGGWPIPSCKGVCGYPSQQNEVSQEKGGETDQPGHPTPTAMQSGSSDFKPPHPWGGGGTSLQANVESQSQSKVSLDKPGLVKNLFLESPGNYQVRR